MSLISVPDKCSDIIDPLQALKDGGCLCRQSDYFWCSVHQKHTLPKLSFKLWPSPITDHSNLKLYRHNKFFETQGKSDAPSHNNCYSQCPEFQVISFAKLQYCRHTSLRSYLRVVSLDLSSIVSNLMLG